LKYKSRRAVSEIIGTLLIVLVTIAIGVALVTLSSSSISTNVLNQSNQAAIESQQIQERSIIYDAWFHLAANYTRLMNLHVLNYGQVTIHFVALYTNVTGTEATFSNFTVAYPSGAYVNPGQAASLNVAFGYTQGTPYDIKIVSASGSVFECIWSA